MNDLLNAITNTNKTIINRFVNEPNQRAAEAALRKQEVDIWQWQEEEMLKFQNRIDVENFQSDYQKDFNELYAKYNKGAEKYANNYTATKGNEMLYRLKTEGEVALAKVINQQDKTKATIYDDDTLKALDKAAPSQMNVDRKANIINIGMQEGRRSLEEGHALLTQLKQESTLQATQKYLDDWLLNNPNATVDEYNNFMQKMNVADLSVKFMGEEIPVDKAAIQKTIIDYADNRLNQYQQYNNNVIYGTNTEIIQHCINMDRSENELLAMIDAQLNVINRHTDLQLDTKDRRQRLEELTRLRKLFDEEPSPDRTERIKTGAYKDLLDISPDLFINAAVIGYEKGSRTKGYGNGYLAYQAYKEAILEAGKNVDGGMKTENQVNIELMVPFFNKLKSKYEDIPQVDGMIDTVESLAKRYAEKSDVDRYELEGEILDYTWDLLFETDMSSLEPKEIVNKVEKKLQTIVAKELSLTKIKNDANPLASFFTGGKAGDYDLAEALTDLKENDYLYTDNLGRQHIDERAMQTVEDKVIPEMARALYTLGIEDADVTPIQTSDSMFDEDLYPKFKDDKGNTYTFEPDEKEGYKVYKNGTEIGTKGDVKKKWNDLRKEQRDEMTAKVNAKKERRAALKAEERKRYDARVAIDTELISKPDIPITGWQGMNSKERRDALYMLKFNDKAKYDELVKKYNLGE